MLFSRRLSHVAKSEDHLPQPLPPLPTLLLAFQLTSKSALINVPQTLGLSSLPSATPICTAVFIRRTPDSYPTFSHHAFSHTRG